MGFKAFALTLISFLPSFIQAEQVSVYDYRLGDHMIDYPLSGLEVIASDIDGSDGHPFIKVPGSNGTNVVLNFRLPSRRLQNLEHNWINRDTKPRTALALPSLSEFTFGETRASEIQAAIGSVGFHYDCLQHQPISNGMRSFISFIIPTRSDAVYTFVVEHSHDLVERGLIEENTDFTAAILVAAIVSRPDYIQDFWCAQRMRYTVTPELPSVPRVEQFEDFLPYGVSIMDPDSWRVVTDPFLMITKNGVHTWGDGMHIIPNPTECSLAAIMAWTHGHHDTGLMPLEGQPIDGTFNLLLSEQTRLTFYSPVTLDEVMYSSIDHREWPDFAIGSFVFGWTLLHKSADGRGTPFPGQTYPTVSVTGMPSAV